MTDAQIKLYAALRVAIPAEWTIYGRSTAWSYDRHAYRDLIIHLERPVEVVVDGVRLPDMREHLAHAVPWETLNDPRYTEGTIALDVQQIVADVARVAA